jgi:aminopeptidase N
VPDARRSLDREPRIASFLSDAFGPYPFEALGGIVDHERLGAALENQTRPLYSEGFFLHGPNTYVIAHELAHQWFGDSVAVDAWQHVWLNEGFATYAEWLWDEERGVSHPAAVSDYYCGAIPADRPFWQVLPGDPGVDDLFNDAVYVRGAMTLQALRRTVGRDAFFEILRMWVADRKDETGTTDQFIATAESVAGVQLDRLFDRWLFTPGKPMPCRSGSPRSTAGRPLRDDPEATIPGDATRG